MLICPSETGRRALEKAVLGAGTKRKRLNAFELHEILISTVHENWRQYLRSLEALIMQHVRIDHPINLPLLISLKSDRVILSQVQDEHEKLSPLTDFNVNFIDCQRLKQIEDKILNLTIIFESLYNTLSKLQRQCKRRCLGNQCIDCVCSNTADELEDQMHEAQVNIRKAEILHKRAQGTVSVVCLNISVISM